ncbi:copper resistance protein CopC [Bacillus sp. ISL-40]|uniref:copper resistance CopC family protein n=1 Tax=unclassified Bacillus (in: firmicutes) TaxID=185979 RepID=UPI001BEBC184|nr:MULTISPECIES: copper resistance protein CopC [unclassified Bacillus (in: firmicutes)]MBT2701386.1 copper resistance protein CopC [Bacillus sp. ISL-40]MBT2743338.1 copper resistance protein CopC [Bacillus sp. ISL-77]
MVKKSLLFTFLIFLTFINNAFAHTGLESSSPQDGEIVKEDLQEITLSFETKVEQSSTFQIINSNGKSIPVENISLNNNKIVGSLQNQLENGSYKVEWNIIGADGHPIKGGFSFSVQVPNKQTQIGQDQALVKQPKQDEIKKANEVNKKYEQKKLPSYVIPSVIVVLIIIVIWSFLLLMRRKK